MQTNLEGTQVGPYRLGRLLGAGGMASVYAAHQSSVEREVAIKILPAHLANQPDYVERFKREVRVAAALEHPHILPIYDHDIFEGISYVVMRLMTGGMLSQRLPASGTLPLPIVLQVLRQTGSAIDFAHRKGIIHRDLKASNILFDEEGNAYLADFGIAKILQDTTKGLTNTGMVVGTPAYMSPEQWRAEPVDGRADLYAFGILAYQLLTGQMPFDAPTPYAFMHKHLNETAPLPTDLQHDLPNAVNSVITKAIAKNKDDRYTSAKIFLDEMEISLDPNKTPAPMIPPLPALEEAATVQTPLDVFLPNTATTQQPQNPPALPMAAQQQQPTSKRRFSWVLGLLIGILLIGGGVLATGIFEGSQEMVAVISSPSPTASTTSTSTATITPSLTPSPTASTTFTSTATITPSSTPSPTASHTFTITPSSTSTDTPTHTPSLTATATTSPSPTTTPVPPTQTPFIVTATVLPASPTQRPTRTSIPTIEVASVNQLTSNAGWSPVTRNFDRVEMVFVPPGCFLMGSNNGDTDERPVHEQCIETGFWIDRYEVSNAQFDRLGGRAEQRSRWDESNTPRETISWYEARDFCAMRGGRLPTEAEWEYAARGPDNLTYPWGHNFEESYLFYEANSGGRTQAVGTTRSGTSWVGAYDMSGNVWEWVSTVYFPYPYRATDGRESGERDGASRQPVVRGGSWTSGMYKTRTTFREKAVPSYGDEYIGLRCARDE